MEEFSWGEGSPLIEKRWLVCYALSMKMRLHKKWLKKINYIVIGCLTMALVCPMLEQSMQVGATSISDVKNQITQTKNELENINNQISEYEAKQELAEEEIADLNAEIINTMTSIGLKEDAIATKEVELVDKQAQIDVTQQEYEKAKQKAEQQYADMLVRIRLMYEMGSETSLSMFLQAEGLADMLNRMDYVERIYEYDKTKFDEYETTQQQVHDLWDMLELEKVGLQSQKDTLEQEQAALEAQKANLDTLLAKKKRESANYEAEIKKAQQQASVAKKLLQQEEKKLAQLQAQANKGNSAATGGNYTSTSYTDTINDASGSEAGKNVAKYACQFIGNPYVYGGTSLTNGADCSGFVYRVYKDFGYSLPRTSTEQRGAGTSVSYDEAEPGDLICYSGHIGIYIGGGKIVHASTERTGIKVSNANYRPILSVRRIV